MNWIEMFGYAASLLVAVSMSMKSLVKLRTLGMIGSGMFSIYGLLIHSIPVFALNGFIASTHFYRLMQIRLKKEYFEIMRVPDVDTPFLKRFVRFYKDDIHRFFPDFSLEKLHNPLIFFLFRNMVPAGLFIAEPRGRETLEIVLDYVTPDFRDMKSAHFVFGRGKKIFGSKGFRRYRARAYVREHEKYLKKLGFRPVSINNEVYYERTI